MDKGQDVTTATPQGSPAKSAKGRRETRDIVRVVVAAAILALLIAFVLDNSQSVTVGFVFFSARVPLIWVLLITAIIGMVIDRLLAWQRSQRRKAAAKSAPH